MFLNMHIPDMELQLTEITTKLRGPYFIRSKKIITYRIAGNFCEVINLPILPKDRQILNPTHINI